MTRNGRFVVTQNGKEITGVQALTELGLTVEDIKGASAPAWLTQRAKSTPALKSLMERKAITINYVTTGTAPTSPPIKPTKGASQSPAKPSGTALTQEFFDYVKALEEEVALWRKLESLRKEVN
jgi:hypothetical protein